MQFAGYSIRKVPGQRWFQDLNMIRLSETEWEGGRSFSTVPTRAKRTF
jgi:hypothetical protein